MLQKIKNVTCIASCIVLTACATNKSFAGLEFEPSYSEDFDYKVSIKNTIGGSFDRTTKDLRRIMIEERFKETCKKVVILEEVEFVTGQYINRPAITYFLKVKCEK